MRYSLSKYIFIVIMKTDKTQFKIIFHLYLHSNLYYYFVLNFIGVICITGLLLIYYYQNK